MEQQHGDNITFGNYYISDGKLNRWLTADEILLTHQESITQPLVVGIKNIASKFSEKEEAIFKAFDEYYKDTPKEEIEKTIEAANSIPRNGLEILTITCKCGLPKEGNTLL